MLVTGAVSTWHLAPSIWPSTEVPSERFQELEGLGEGASFDLDVYRTTARFPREELYGLTSQMRRCCASIGANIAEGCGKRGNNEFQRFLQIASGSASELDYHFLLARDLLFLHVEDYTRLEKQLSILRRMMTSLLQRVDSERCLTKCQVPIAKCWA